MRNAVITATARRWVFVLAAAGAIAAGVGDARAGLSIELPQTLSVSNGRVGSSSLPHMGAFGNRRGARFVADGTHAISASIDSFDSPAWLLRPEILVQATRHSAGLLPRPVLPHGSQRNTGGAIPAPTAAVNGAIGIAGLMLAGLYRRLRRAV